MLVDTGADISLLPRDAIAALLEKTDLTREFELEVFDGSRSTAFAVHLEVRFLEKVFRGQFLVMNGAHGVLGRNILNSLALVFDGPRLQWEEFARC